MTRTIKILFVLTLFISQGPTLLSQEIQTKWIKYIKEEYAAGSSETMVLQISTTSKDTLQLFDEIVTPDDWFSMASGSHHFTMLPGESINRLYAFRIPSSAETGQVTIRIGVVDKSSGETVKKFTIPVFIKPSFKVAIEPIETQKYVTAGAEILSTYRIVNGGNTEVELEIKGKGGKLQETDTLTLKPKESRTVSLKVNAPKTLIKPGSKSFGLELECDEFDTSFSSIDYVQVFPNLQLDQDPYERFPINITTNYLGRVINGEYRGGIQMDIYGNSRFIDSLNDRLQFRLRGPDRANFTNFGNYEEYYVSYERSKFGFQLGDQGFRLTNLTELSRYGRGASGFYNVGQVQFKGFYGKSRFFPTVEDIGGLATTFTDRDNRFFVSTSYLYKEFTARTDSAANIYSLNAGLKLKNLNVTGELAHGFSGTTRGTAFEVNARGQIKKFRVAGSLLSADKNFPGFYQNSLIANGTMGYNFGKIRVGVAGNYFDSNPSLDTFFVAAPFSYSMVGSIRYSPNKTTRIEAFGGQRRRKDRFELSLFDYRENFARVGLEKTYDRFTVELVNEYTRNINFQIASDSALSSGYNARLNTSYKLLNTLRVHGNIIYQSNNPYSTGQFRNWNIGGQLDWQASVLTNLRIGYQNTLDVEQYFNNQDFFLLDLNQSFDTKKKHQVSVIARYSKPRRQIANTNAYFNVKYTYRFDFPKYKKRNQGRIKGRVVFMDSSAVQGAVIRVSGYTAVSDENGDFNVPNLKAGIYYMTVERTSIGFNQITQASQPIRVDILPNQTTETTINLTNSARLVGKISFPVGLKNKLLDKRSKKQKPVYIEISNGGERFIAPSDTNGVFQFNYLRPGNWTIKLIQSTLDQNMVFDKIKVNVELKPGDSKSVKFRARRKQKKLKMIGPPLKLTARKQG